MRTYTINHFPVSREGVSLQLTLTGTMRYYPNDPNSSIVSINRITHFGIPWEGELSGTELGEVRALFIEAAREDMAREQETAYDYFRGYH